MFNRRYDPISEFDPTLEFKPTPLTPRWDQLMESKSLGFDLPAPDLTNWNEAMEKIANRRLDLADALRALREAGYTKAIPIEKLSRWETLPDEEWNDLIRRMQSLSKFYNRKKAIIGGYDKFFGKGV